MAKTERTSRQNLNASRNGSNANRQVSAGSKNQDLTKMNKQNRESILQQIILFLITRNSVQWKRTICQRTIIQNKYS